MKLKQYRAKRESDGAAVVEVVDEGGFLSSLLFADEQGCGKTLDVEAAQYHEIRDGEAVTEAGQLRVYVLCFLV